MYGREQSAVGKADSRSGGRGKMQKAAFLRGRRGRVRSLVHAGFRAGVRGHLPRNKRLAENIVKRCGKAVANAIEKGFVENGRFPIKSKKERGFLEISVLFIGR